MSIVMIGIDHHLASVDYREMFAFTRKKSAEAMIKIKETEGILGCIIVSTCNRTEVWVSTSDTFEGSLFDILCEIKSIKGRDYEDLFVKRMDYNALKHLFSLTSGLDSKILGEDQIITQIKDALNLSRENYCTDNVLEIMFRMAVTAAKKVKTNIVLSRANASVIHHIVNQLKLQGFEVLGKRCMVIGNGEMGKLAANVLKEAGGDVTVTVRQYKSGVVQIPEGCKRINYGERMSLFHTFDLIVSATASPNYTVKAEEVGQCPLDHPIIIIDLAVPRDVENAVGEFEHICLYDIDDFNVDVQSEQLRENIQKAHVILEEQMKEFIQWYECRDMIPKIKTITAMAASDMEARVQKRIDKLEVAGGDKQELETAIETAAARVVAKMMFGLRDTVSPQAFRECITGLEKIYPQERG